MKTAPPNLPLAPPEYARSWMDRYTRDLMTFFTKLTSTGPIEGTTLTLVNIVLASRLLHNLTSSATTIQVEHPEYFPTKGYGTLNNSEKFYWDGIIGNTLQNVLRGQLGTTAVAHNTHDVVVPTAVTGAIYAHPVDNALFRVF